MTPLGFWDRVDDLATSITNRLAKPFRAKATSVNSSGVQIQTYDADSPLGERYPRLRDAAINTGDEVAVIPYGGSFLVLGAIDSLGVRALATDGTDDASVIHIGDAANQKEQITEALDALDLDDTNELKKAVNLLRTVIGV